jgi:hypothetical protein
MPYHGVDSGIDISFPHSCSCGATKAFWREWTRFEARSSRFAKVNFKYLEPNAEQSSLPLDRQAEIIALLKAQPTDSYFLFGPPNTGKTHFMTALHRLALRRWSCAPSSNLIKASFRELQLEFRSMPSWSASLRLRASSMKLGALEVFRDGGADPKQRGSVRPSCTSMAGGSTGALRKRFAIWQAISLLMRG